MLKQRAVIEDLSILRGPADAGHLRMTLYDFAMAPSQKRRADPVHHELHRQRGQHHAEQAGEDGVAGDAEQAVHALGGEIDGKARGHHHGGDDEQPGEPHRIALGVAGQQHHGGDGAGPAISGMASGNTERWWRWCSRIIASAFSLLRSVRRPNTISKEMANSSSPPAMRKAGKVMPSAAKQRRADGAEHRQYAERDDRGAPGDAATLFRGQAASDGQEDRREAGRVEHDQHGHRRRDEIVEHGRAFGWSAASRPSGIEHLMVSVMRGRNIPLISIADRAESIGARAATTGSATLAGTRFLGGNMRPFRHASAMFRRSRQNILVTY